MKSKAVLLAFTLGTSVWLCLPCWAQPTYTPFNSYSPDAQLRGAGDSSSYQNPNNIDQSTFNGAPGQNNNANAGKNHKNKHNKQKVAKNKSGKSAVGTVAGAPTKAAKTGVGLTDKTAKAGVGLTDRAAKVGVGAPAKALKETLKAVF